MLRHGDPFGLFEGLTLNSPEFAPVSLPPIMISCITTYNYAVFRFVFWLGSVKRGKRDPHNCNLPVIRCKAMLLKTNCLQFFIFFFSTFQAKRPCTLPALRLWRLCQQYCCCSLPFPQLWNFLQAQTSLQSASQEPVWFSSVLSIFAI